MKRNSDFPDFLIIGAGKSGTTSLDKYLNQHPDIFMSPVKEPNFFAYELTKESDLKDHPDELKHFKGSITSIDLYKNLFKDASDSQLKGETSNTYLYGKDAPYRIKYHIPDIKLIAILRQPAERLYSRYLHLYRDNRLPTRSFLDCKDKNSIWWKRNDLINEGFYCKHLKRYYDLFPHENIKILLYDDIKKDLSGMIKEIFTFLNVDNTYKCDFSVRYNESGIIKNRVLNNIIGANGYVQNSLKKISPIIYNKMLNNSSAQRVLNEIRSKNMDKPTMDPNIKNFLNEEVYREDILCLKSLTNLNIDSWLK